MPEPTVDELYRALKSAQVSISDAFHGSLSGKDVSTIGQQFSDLADTLIAETDTTTRCRYCRKSIEREEIVGWVHRNGDQHCDTLAAPTKAGNLT